ncbi:reverse transcriptase domain-containing protein [Tanacetum coccineum]
MDVKNLVAKVYSRLVANQINGSNIVKEQSMIQYLEKAKALIISFKKFSIEKVPRSKNKKADSLSRIASTSFAHLTKQVLVEVLKEKSIEENEILEVVEEEGHSWMTSLIEYLADGTLPVETKQARSIKIKLIQYVMINGVLYRGFVYDICYEVLIGILQGERTKARLGEENRNWVEEVSHVLWARCAMIKTNNEDTLFSLTYGTEAVIPVEIWMPSLRCAEVNQAQNDEALLLNLDILKERRENDAICEAKSKAKWKSTTTLRSAARPSGQGTLSIVAMSVTTMT